MMVGRRKNNPLGLEPRVQWNHGQCFYIHRSGKWEPLGTDIAKANERARLYNDTAGRYGTLHYWLDMFVVECEQRVKAGTLAARTLDDYRDDVERLKASIGKDTHPDDVTPEMVQQYLEAGAMKGRPVRANREKACLSSCMGWLVRTGKVPGLLVNPCLRASGIRRNEEKKRDRYVTHDEYRDVFAVAPPQVQAMMELTYRTLQRPESDILDWTCANVTTKDGKRILRVKQSKTQKVVDIALSQDLDSLIRRLVGDVPKIGRPLICTSRAKGGAETGQRYTYDGISAMLKRAIKKANKERAKDGGEKIASFGFRDLKGKGATDMWLNGVPIEEIQLLCGHDDKATTETYIKQRWRETAEPNTVQVGA
jgi:integrase